MNNQSSLRVLLIESDKSIGRQLATWLADDATGSSAAGSNGTGSGAAGSNGTGSGATGTHTSVTVECVPDLEAARIYLLENAHTERRIDIGVLRLDAAAQLAPQHTDAPTPHPSAPLQMDDPIYNVVAAWHTMAPHIPLVGILTLQNASGPTHHDPAASADHALGQRAIRAGAQDYLIAPTHQGQEIQRILWGAQIRHAQLLLRIHHISPPLPRADSPPGLLSTAARHIAARQIRAKHNTANHSADNDETENSTPESFTPESPTLAQMMESLRASEARLRAIIESEPECVKLVAIDGRVLDMNPAGLRLIEADDRAQIVNQPIAGVLHPEDAKAFFQLHRQAAQGANGTLQFRMIGLKGTQRWMETHSTPLRDGNGAITAVLSVARDITASRQGQNVIMRMAHAVSRPIGEHFLENLTRDAVAALEVKGALVAQLDPTDPNRIQTQTFFLDGEFQDNIDYGLDLTPCKNVAQGESCVYIRDIQQQFPQDRMLAEFGLEAYVGVPMYAPEGEVMGKVMGVVAVFHDQPLQYPDLILSATRIFAARAAGGTQRLQLDRELRESRRRLLLLLESVPQGIHGLDRDGHITFENPAALQMLGWQSDEMVGKNAHALIHHHDVKGQTYPAEECPILQTITDGKIRRVDSDVFFRKDGSSFPVEYVCSPVIDETGTIQGAVLSFTDITQAKQDELLRATEQEILELISESAQLSIILERIVLGIEALCPEFIASIVLIDPDARCLRHGAAPHLPDAFSQAIDGLDIGPKAGSCGTAAYRGERVVVTDIATDPLWDDYRELAQSHNLAACWSTPVLAPDGGAVATYALYSHVPRAPQPGELEIVEHVARWTGIAIARDQERRVLQASEERFRRIFQDAATGILVTSREGQFLQTNDAYCAMLGYSEAELRALDFSSITHPDDVQTSREMADELRAGLRRGYVLEKRYITKAGPIIWTRLSIAGLYDDNGALIGHIGVAEDISRRKQAEAELERNQALLRSASQISRLGGWAVEIPDYTFTWSEAVQEMHEVGPDFVPTLQDALNFYAPHGRDAMRRAFWACAKEGIPYDLELELTSATGRELWVRTIGEAVRDETGKIVRVQGAFQDITARKATEQSLRESEERFRLLAKATTDAIWDWDLNSNAIWWNENYAMLFGHNSPVGKMDSDEWASHLHPDERDQVVRDLYAVIAQADSNWQREYRYHRHDGTYAHVLDRGFVIRNDAGEAVRMVGGMTDLTERKNLEEQILRAQRMESLGVLAGGIAHDLNNILTPILLSAYLLKKSVTTDQARKQLEILEETATRGTEMVRQVLTFARGSEGQRIPVAVDRIAQEVAKLMQDTLSRNIKSLLTIKGIPWTVIGDPTQVHQVLVNLCVNARDAMPQGGRLTIEVDNLQVDEQYASMVPEASPAPYVRITVSDTGMGIAKDILDHIFDPFYTTKAPGKGTGLGLSTVQGIVRGHGGFITVYSEERRGTTFRIYLPAHTDMASAPIAPEVIQPPVGNGELILVVDDEKLVRTMTQQTLETYGYRAIVAEDGAQALSMYVQHRDDIALVLTDMMMPIMDGFATIQALYKIEPNLKIVAASGLAATGMASKAARAGVEHFLHKPYTAESILTILAQALGKI